MKTRLLFACQFVSLCASLPLYAKEQRASGTEKPDTEKPDEISERVAALVEPKSEHQAPADAGEAGTAPKKTSDAAKTSGDANANKKSKKKSGKGKKKKQDADSAAGRKISLEEDFLVEGKLEKPNAYYILRRSQAGYDWARLDAKFLPLVLESVQDPLF
jgi:hypothetical protein